MFPWETFLKLLSVHTVFFHIHSVCSYMLHSVQIPLDSGLYNHLKLSIVVFLFPLN